MKLKIKSEAIHDLPDEVINRRDDSGLKPAADFSTAYDTQGYWYINTPYSEGAHGVPIKAVGFDPGKKPGAILGPFPLP